ncbi:Protein yellow [Gryllus bimaculatus]|nr:Protein yellow [Gryllus bimaculatus]
MSCRIEENGHFGRRQARNGLRKQWTCAVRPALCAVALRALLGSASALQRMTLQYTWGSFAFAFDSEEQRQQISARPGYAPQNSTPLDVDFDRATGRCFLSFPAVLPGGPVALATVRDKDQRESPQLAPYPDWSWHAGQRGCDGITSVFRIYGYGDDRSWRVESDTFRPDPNAESFVVNGSTMTLQDGVMGLALNDGDDHLYYQALSSFRAGRVPKVVLRDEALFANGTNLAADKHNQHVVEHDSTLLHFVTGMKAISQGSPEELWAIDNNGQRAFTGEFQPDLPYTVNIVRGPVSDLSSKCSGSYN